MTAPTGRPSEMRNLAPDEPPRPKRHEQIHPLLTPQALYKTEPDTFNFNLSKNVYLQSK